MEEKRKWRIAATTNPFGPNQLEELGKKLNEGVENVEIGTLELKKFETIPTQHLQEIRRLAKITGTGLSFHAPIDIDPAGITKNKWSEEQRIKSQNMLAHAMNRIAEGLVPETKKTGEKSIPIPVVMHAGSEFSQQYEKGLKRTVIKDGKEVVTKFDDDLGIRAFMAVNQTTGEMHPLEHKEKFRIGKKEKDIWDVYKQLKNLNVTSWNEEQLKIFRLQHDIQERQDKIDQRKMEEQKLLHELEEAKQRQNKELIKAYEQHIQRKKQQDGFEINNLNNQIEQMNQNLASQVESIQDTFRKNPTVETKKDIEDAKIAMQIMQQAQQLLYKQIRQIERNRKQTEEEIHETKEINTKEKQERITSNTDEAKQEARRVYHNYNSQLTGAVAKLPAPQTWVPVKDFAKTQTAKTVANAMFEVYEKQSKRLTDDSMPFIAIENFFPNTPISTGKELKETVENARKQMAERLQKEKNIEKKRAETIAKNMIGATWDMGHITALRQAGFENAELKKQVLKQTRDVRDVVKHVHITDNFGWHDSHLAPGMGIVPIEEIMKEMEEVGFAGTAVEEAGGFISEFKNASTPYAKEFFGSPIYGPSATQNAYRPTPENFIEFPQHHFNLYSSSFTSLPKVFGGKVGGEKSRFSGTPNQ